MTLSEIFHMNNGDDNLSYANNSFFQRIVMQKAEPFIRRAIKDLAKQDVFFDRCFKVADLGCSSSENTLLVASTIIDVVHEVCQEKNHKAPQLQVCLNDLFGNDFNYIFKLLPNFYKTIQKEKGETFGPCFISAVPGSFYDRLFLDESLHLIHSSYSIHWLSQVPEGLEDNKLHIYITKTSPLSVTQAYGKQFHTDFSNFLRLRSVEIIRGGHMILTLPTWTTLDPTCDDYCGFTEFSELLSISLVGMLKEGMVQESDIISFNFPVYIPHEDELRNIIEADGTFLLDNIDIFELSWDQTDAYYANMDEVTHGSSHNDAKNIANLIRSTTEPILASHFGESIIDELFVIFEKNVTECLAIKRPKQFNVVVSLTKK